MTPTTYTNNKPTDDEIAATALLLEKVLGCDMVSKPIQTPCTTGDSQYRGLSSVQACYEAFEALPENHPLRQNVNSTNVMLGYYGLEGLMFNPSKNYQELAAVVTIASKK